MTWRVIAGDARGVLPTLVADSVHCCVTSPPYWGLRDYGVPPSVWAGEPTCEHEWGQMERGKRSDMLPADVDTSAGRSGSTGTTTGQLNGGRYCARCGAWGGQLGLEPTPELYVEHLVAIMREVRRVLRADGTLWLNLGDSYVSAAPGNNRPDHSGSKMLGSRGHQESTRQARRARAHGAALRPGADRPAIVAAAHLHVRGLASKQLIGVPWRVAFALQADGWWLRSDIIWHKRAPMPESVRDRPTKAHEYVFLFAKSARYYYDADAVKEPATHAGRVLDYTGEQKNNSADPVRQSPLPHGRKITVAPDRNLRDVWSLGPEQFPGAHYAVMPTKLVEPCIRAGCPPGGTVLDPFCGAGTVGLVADRLGRDFVGVDASAENCEMARSRIRGDAPLLTREIDR